MMLHPLRGDFFICTADFADDHNGFCFWIIVEQAQHIEMFQAIDWIAADADRRGLTQAKRGQLRNGFIRERTGTPSVIQMTKSRSASTASQMADAAPAGGTYMTDTVAPVLSLASPTVPKTGMPSKSSPARFGLTPAT